MDQKSLIPTLRAIRDVAQADLATAVGVSASTMSNIETGRTTPSPAIVARIAEALDCPPEAVGEGSFVLLARPEGTEIEAITT